MKEERDEGNIRVYMQLELAEELAEGTEERDRLRNRVKFLELAEETYQGKEKAGDAGVAGVAGAKLEKLSIHCSRGRPGGGADWGSLGPLSAVTVTP